MSLNPLQTSSLLPAPIPIETSRRSNRPNKANHVGLFQPHCIETTRRSNRTTLHRRVEDVGSEAPSCAPSRAASRVPSPVRGEKKSLASSIFFPKPQIAAIPAGTDTLDYFSVSSVANTTAKTEIPLPQPIETSRRSNRKPAPAPAPVSEVHNRNNNETPPPTPPPPVDAQKPALVPQPFEVSRRSNRPLARPLVAIQAEQAPKSNLSRRPDMHIDLADLPQPVSSSRWTNRITKPGARHLRRSSTVQPPGTPGLYYFVPETGHSSATPSNPVRGPGKWVRPTDHVEHFAGLVDSTPSSPSGSPKHSRTPTVSDGDNIQSNKLAKRPLIDGRRDSLEEGYSGYILDIQRRKLSSERPGPKSPKSPKSPGASRLRMEQKIDYSSIVMPIPVPVASNICRRDSELPDDLATEKEKELLRAKARGGTTKPMRIGIPTVPARKVYDEYPIFSSPTKEDFLPKPERVSTKDLAAAKPIPIPSTTPSSGNLPTPPDSNPTSSQQTMLSFGRLKIPVVGMFYPSSLHNLHHPSQLTSKHSPGITVASLPPRKDVNPMGTPMVPLKPSDVTDAFVGEVWRYLSFEHECIARRYDDELCEYIGWRTERVVQDRWGALKEYIKLWVGVNPELNGGDKPKGGLW